MLFTTTLQKPPQLVSPIIDSFDTYRTNYLTIQQREINTGNIIWTTGELPYGMNIYNKTNSNVTFLIGNELSNINNIITVTATSQFEMSSTISFKMSFQTSTPILLPLYSQTFNSSILSNSIFIKQLNSESGNIIWNLTPNISGIGLSNQTNSHISILIMPNTYLTSTNFTLTAISSISQASSSITFPISIF
jgi:hypothetical protein